MGRKSNQAFYLNLHTAHFCIAKTNAHYMSTVSLQILITHCLVYRHAMRMFCFYYVLIVVVIVVIRSPPVHIPCTCCVKGQKRTKRRQYVFNTLLAF